jgi:hypothetical protein
MSLDLSALSVYTKENENELIVATIFGAKTQELIQKEGNVMTGISTSEKINQLETDAVFQAGGTCGYTPSGTTKITRRTITVGPIKVHESLCPKVLKSYYLQLRMKPGSQPEATPFNETYTSRKAAIIAKNLENAIWQGDLSSGNAQLNKFDGFIKIIDASNLAVASNAIKSAGTITGTTAAATITGVGTAFSTALNNSQTGAAGPLIGAKVYSAGILLGVVASVASDTSLSLVANLAANVTAGPMTVVLTVSKTFAAPILSTAGVTPTNIRVNIVTNQWQSIIADVKGNDDVRIFCGWEVYETFIAALIALNLYTYTANNGAQQAGEIKLPGTNYTLTAVHGLDATNRIYAIRLSNMYLGCDIMGEEDRWEIFFAKEADEVRFVAEWKLGVQVAFPAEIVQFTLA